MAESTSPKYKLNKSDLQKLLTGFLIAVGGAIVTYIAQAVTNVDFGSYTPVVVAISSVAINAARKFLKNYQ